MQVFHSSEMQGTARVHIIMYFLLLLFWTYPDHVTGNIQTQWTVQRITLIHHLQAQGVCDLDS